MTIEFTQSGLDLMIDTDGPVQFSRDTPVRVTLKDDTFAAADDLSLNFVPEDGRKHAPARVELTKSDADGVYTGVIGKAAALVSGISSVALGGIVTSTGQVITSRAERVMIDRSVDPEQGALADPATLADVVAAAVDSWLQANGIPTDSTISVAGKPADAGTVRRDAVMASGSVRDSSIYTSVDDFPRNSIMMVSTTAITNRPGNRGNFTVVTLSPYKNTSLTASLQIAISNIGVPYMRTKWGSGWTAWVTLPSTYDEDIASVKSAATPYTSIALFQRIGVIGDSFASGEICVDGHYTDYYNRSWGQIMARRNGITCTNYSRGGLSTRTWLTDAKGLTLLNATTADELYLIALGINDAGLGSDYVGTSADIGTDNDTFYGNYAKIINAVQSHAPDAKIVLLGMANPSSTTVKQAINNAINAIASHYGIPFIDQTQDDFFTSDFYLKNMVLGHPVGVVYAGMATAIERLLSQCMIDNLAYFKDFT